MNRAGWYSRKNITGKEDIAARMGAGIVLTIIKQFRSPDAPNSWNKEKRMATAKNKTGGKKNSIGAKKKLSGIRPKTGQPHTVKEKLKALKPSGQKDDSFFDLVHEIARQVPRGRVTSYGAIAACLGTRLSARLVGWAMNVSGNAGKPVPAHRVVNRNGMLTGKHHFNPSSLMEELLKKEGVKVKNEKVVNFAALFWDPSKEL
jgi:methylated-DNA-protein-cysteine methyltransferase related protein